MRRIKARRRFKFVLSVLCIACFILFCESRIEAFAPHIRNFAVLKIEETFNGRLKFSIGSLDGGILHPLVLNNIKIKDRKGASLFSSLDINSIRTNYRIWDILLKRNENSTLSHILARDSRVYVNFVAKDSRISGFVRLDGDLENSSLKGYIKVSDSSNVDFTGSVKQDRFELDIRPAKGSLKAEGFISDAGDFEVNFKVDHINWHGLDLVCDAALRSRIVEAGRADAGCIEGKFWTKNLIVNYNPFMDLEASYRIANRRFEITDSSLGNNFRGRGSISLTQPFNTDFHIFADNVNLNWLFSRLGAQDAVSVLSGTMNGKFEFKGAIANLKSHTHLEIKKGTISELDFDYLDATLKGDGPILRIEDSKITRESGYFTLAGEMDLRKMGKITLFSNIKLSSDDRAITWDGWNSKKVQDVQELSMKKRINDDIDVNFKTFFTEEKVDESIKEADEVQLEYKLHPNNSLQVTMSQDSDFFGFEHKDKF